MIHLKYLSKLPFQRNIFEKITPNVPKCLGSQLPVCFCA
jgi:hypothetical protein